MTTTRTIREDESGARLILTGDRGAIECCTTLAGAPLAIVYHHSLRPQRPGDEHAAECDVFADGCYPGASASASDLRETWLAGDCDDEVIWRALEDRCRAWNAED